MNAGTERAHILIVEDDQDIRESVVDILQDHNYIVSQATDGADALAKLADRPPPNLILLDVMMPKMDGFEFREKQLQNERLAGIPIIVMSAIANVRFAAEQMHAFWFMRKPIDLPVLLKLVDAILSERRVS